MRAGGQHGADVFAAGQDQFLGRALLGEVAGYAAFEQAQGKLLFAMRGENEDAQAGGLGGLMVVRWGASGRWTGLN